LLTELEGSVLRLIRDYPNISRLDIAKKLGVSKPVVTNVVARLIKKGLVVESGTKKTKVGRPKITLQFVPDTWYCVGIELEEKYFELIVTDLAGRVIDSQEEKISGSVEPNHLVSFCKEKVERTLEENHLPKEKVLGVGMGIAGMVDPSSRVVRTAPAIGLTNYDLASEVSEKLDLNVIVVNRVKAAALAEHRLGAAQGFQNVLFVFIDSGLGCATLLDGKIYEGFYGKAGEFGWMITDLDRSEPELYEEESFGHLARRFSGHAISKRFANLGLNGEDILRLVTHNEELRDSLERGLKHIAAAVANAVLLFDPQLIILKGRIGQNYYEHISQILLSTLKWSICPFQTTGTSCSFQERSTVVTSGWKGLSLSMED